jgi:thioredoxin-related protein
MMKKIFVTFFMLLMVSSASFSAETRDPYKFFFDETFGDLTEEIENAKEQNKKAIFMFFEMDECPFCHRMKTTILNQKTVQNYFKEHFLMLPMDIEGDIQMVNFKGEEKTQKEFSEKENRVRATPVLAFFDLTGKRIFRYTGTTTFSDEFLMMSKYVVEEHYKTMRFSKFKR